MLALLCSLNCLPRSSKILCARFSNCSFQLVFRVLQQADFFGIAFMLLLLAGIQFGVFAFSDATLAVAGLGIRFPCF